MSTVYEIGPLRLDPDAGLLSDANGAELTLDAGPHTIELHQDGYETLRENVRIPFGSVITYRAELKRLLPARPAAVMPPVPPPAPATIYMIPRCYVGNIRLEDWSNPTTSFQSLKKQE